MCANCGFPAAPGHWTEAGTDTSYDRLQARYRRASLLREVLRDHGLTAHDDATTPGITVSTKTGRHEFAGDLAAVWALAEKLSGRPVDPLAPKFVCDDDDALSARQDRD
ncbi:MAG TPA: hypothetical protein PKE65_07380 [Rhizobiaceae bacterium]|nr:hypothetical protein [Rhizobiaceae bacterium]